MTDEAKLRILFHHRIASRDGQAVHMEELIDALRRQGHEVELVGPRAFQAQSFGGEVSYIAMLKRALPPFVYELLEVGYSFYAFWPLLAAYRRFRPHAIYERYSLFMLAGAVLKRITGVPYLLEVNGPLYEERTEHDGLALRRLGRFCQRWLWRTADYVLPVTDVLADYVRAAGVPGARIAIVPNAIDPAKFASHPDAAEAKKRLGLDGRLVLGFTGFVKAWNRMDQALHAMARPEAPANMHLLLVGDGPARQDLESLAKSLGLADRFTVTGIVDRNAVAAHVSAFDIAMLPGVTSYSSPLKLFEYMALQRAVIAPDMRNIREILKHDHNAYLFDPAAEDGFASAILALANDDARRQRLGACAARDLIERRLTWDENAARVAAMIRSRIGS